MGCHSPLQRYSPPCDRTQVSHTESEVAQSCVTLCDPMDCSLPGSSIHGIFLGKSTGVGGHFLLQHYRQIFCHLSHQESLLKNLPANSGDIRDAVLIPMSRTSRGGGHGNPLQCSCLENPMDRGAWQATVYRVTKSWTQLKQLNMHAHDKQYR